MEKFAACQMERERGPIEKDTRCSDNYGYWVALELVLYGWNGNFIFLLFLNKQSNKHVKLTTNI